MPISLAALQQGKAITVPVEFAGEHGELTVNPAAVTPSLLSALNESQQNPAALARCVAALVTSWDVLGPDGAPLPVTEETCAGLPLGFLATVIQAIGDAVKPGKSSAGSFGAP